MQRSAQGIRFNLSLGLIIALLCANSQALPLLDNSLEQRDAIANPEPIRYPPSIRNAEEKRSTPRVGDEDVISLHGISGRDIDASEHTHQHHDQSRSADLNVRDFPYQHESQISFLNTSPFPLQASNPPTAITPNPERHSITVPSSSSTQDTEIKQDDPQVHNLNGGQPGSLSLPISISAPHAASPQSPSPQPGVPTLNDLYAPKRDKHEHNDQPHVSRPWFHNGNRRIPFFRPHPIFRVGKSWGKSTGHVKHGVAHTHSMMEKLAHMMGIPLRFPHHIGATKKGNATPEHSPKPRIIRIMFIGKTIPTPITILKTLSSILKAPLRLPGHGPGGRIYQQAHSPQPHSPHKPLHQDHAAQPPLEGTIKLFSPTLSPSHPIPLNFKLSSSPHILTPTLHKKCACLPLDLATLYLRTYPNGVNPPHNTLSHTIAMGSVKMTQNLTIEGGMKGEDFKALLGLLLSAKRELDKAALGRGVEDMDVSVRGEWRGTGFEAGWSWS